MSRHRIRTSGAWRQDIFVGKRRTPFTPVQIAVLVVLASLTCVVLGLCSFEAYSFFQPADSPAAAGEPPAQVIYEIIVPRPTRTNTATPPPPTRTPTPHPTLPPTQTLNGVTLNRIVVMSDAARKRIRQIYARGQTYGRNPRAFAKVGDSTMFYPPFLAAFEQPTGYRLGTYGYLQPTIAYYDGSFGRSSAAVKIGMHSWTEFDPTWDNSDACQSNEGPLACELRLTNPSIVFIRLGANDSDVPQQFNQEMRKIVDFCIGNGVIPVLGTKPDQRDGPNGTLNKLVRQIAAAYSIPLWDYEAIVTTIPGRGLQEDQLHIRGGGSRDYNSSAAFASGDSLEDLTGLMMLDAVRRELAAVTPQK